MTYEKPKPTHWDRTPTAKERSSRQEKRIARDFGATLTPNSGATFVAKGDAVEPRFRFEMKHTTRKQFPVDTKVLQKIWDEATATGHLAAVVVTMESIATPVPKDWVVIEKTTFEALARREI